MLMLLKFTVHSINISFVLLACHKTFIFLVSWILILLQRALFSDHKKENLQSKTVYSNQFMLGNVSVGRNFSILYASLSFTKNVA